MEGGDVPVLDTRMLSDDAVAAGRTLAEAGPGQRVVYDEDVWEFVGDWERGTWRGTVTIEETLSSQPGRRSFLATFRIDGIDEPIEVTGFVPDDGVGQGRGNGRHKDRAKSVPFEWRNPKSWG